MEIEFEPLRLTDESVEDLRKDVAAAVVSGSQGSIAGIGNMAVHSVGNRIAAQMPSGLSAAELPIVAQTLADQIIPDIHPLANSQPIVADIASGIIDGYDTLGFPQ